MSENQIFVCMSLLAVTLTGSALGQEAQEIDESQLGLIAAVDFMTIPPGFGMVSPVITLQGDVDVEGTLRPTGPIEVSDQGIVFPDGSVQTTASGSGLGLTANQGQYSNRIALTAPSVPFTEVCVKGGAVLSDIHTVAESSAGGSCLPGDIGWIIERDERSAASWEVARMECLKGEMRLPEVFEFKYSCINDTQFGLSSMQNNSEWVSNTSETTIRDAIAKALFTQVMGDGNCIFGGPGAIASLVGGGSESIIAYRCIR